MIGHLIFTKVVKTSIAFNILRIDASHIKLYIRRRLYPAIESVRGRRSDERNFSLLFSFFPPFFHARTHATTQIRTPTLCCTYFLFYFSVFRSLASTMAVSVSVGVGVGHCGRTGCHCVAMASIMGD